MNVITLLAPDEPDPVLAYREAGSSPFFITCDHAGRLLPRSLGTLGLADGDLKRHIAWDIGAWAVSLLLARALDATAIGQRYSRLVIDCNRRPDVPSSIPAISEATEVPGNVGLSKAARTARVCEVFQPYHDRIARMLDARAERPTVMIAMHSFTPIYKGVARAMHAGMLFNRDPRLGRALLGLLRAERGIEVRENEPYAVSDETDYGIPVHAERRGLPHVELEIRQDLIADEAGQHRWAELLARLLPAAYERIDKAV
jgi:predicted N-formylglutamate amidohydrolase